MVSRNEILKGAGKAARLFTVVGTLSIPAVGIANAEHDGSTKNVKIGEASSFDYFHPMSGDQVWSYGVQLRNPQLPGAGIFDTDQVGEVLLTGAGDVGLDLRTDPNYLADYRGNGARAAVWLRTGPNDEVVLIDQRDGRNDEVAVATADNSGFAGVLLPDRVTDVGIKVKRTSGSTAPVLATFGNISAEDYATKIPNDQVIDAAKSLPLIVSVAPAAQPVAQETQQTSAQPESIDFLPEQQLLKWADGAGKGFFRPISSNGEGYTPFLEFAVDSSSQVAFQDKGNVGEFFSLVRGASQVKLDVIANSAFADHIRQGQQAPAFWLSGLPPGTKVLLHDKYGSVVAEATGDGAGFGGVQIPDYDSRFTVTLNFPGSVSVDVKWQMGPARPEDLAKSSTVKLDGVDSSRLRIIE